jgi:hypothetical protein
VHVANAAFDQTPPSLTVEAKPSFVVGKVLAVPSDDPEVAFFTYGIAQQLTGRRPTMSRSAGMTSTWSRLAPEGHRVVWIGDLDELNEVVGALVSSVRDEGADFDRLHATVLFTDIVDSTSQSAAMGDHAWRTVQEGHDQIVRAQLARCRGREIRRMGDGFLATFDGPGRAVRCAQAISAAVRPLGIEIRAGTRGRSSLLATTSPGSRWRSAPAWARSPGRARSSSRAPSMISSRALGFRWKIAVFTP